MAPTWLSQLQKRIGLKRDQVSETWLREHARGMSRIEFHGSGQPWKFNRIEMDAAWRNRFELRKETQQQERRRA